MARGLDRSLGNPMSMHAMGDEPRRAMEAARRQVADLIHADPLEIYFVSCGTEANNTAIRGIASAYSRRGNHIITSAIEHSSILQSCQALEHQGFQVTTLPVDSRGWVDPGDVERAITNETILISVMMANNEIGTIQPILEIARLARERDVVFHTDAVSAAGRIPIDVGELGVGGLSLAANQFYGPPGCGVLYIRRGVRLDPLLLGGVQEKGRRAGSENILGILGCGRAAEIARCEMAAWRTNLEKLQMQMQEGLQEKIDRMTLTGHPTQRLPGHVSLCLEFVEGEAMIRALSQNGIAAATGSACRDYTTRKISHVLEAVGLEIRLAQGSLFFSIGRDNTAEDIQYALEVLPPIVRHFRSISPVYASLNEGG